jgi:hypothetical protein
MLPILRTVLLEERIAPKDPKQKILAAKQTTLSIVFTAFVLKLQQKKIKIKP